jgi:hypothetical protein
LPYLARDPQATCFSPAESERERHIEQRKQRRTRVQCHRVLACKCAIARTVVDRP